MSVGVPRRRARVRRARAGMPRGPCPSGVSNRGRWYRCSAGAAVRRSTRSSSTRSAIRSVLSHASGSSRKTCRISCGALQVELLGVELQPLRIGLELLLLDAEQHVVRLRVLLHRVVQVVRRDERDAERRARARPASARTRRWSGRPWSCSSMKNRSGAEDVAVAPGGLLARARSWPASSTSTARTTGIPRGR